jgi:hypothetical protein
MQLEEILAILLALLAFFAPIGFVIFKSTYQRRREKEKSREHIHDVVVEMSKHGKIRRGRGKYHPHNWAMKWIEYSKNIPVSRQRYQMSGGELPKLPRINE